MAYKASNPAKRSLIMNIITIVLVLIFQMLLLITVVKLYMLLSDNGNLDDITDFFLAMCGICILWPMSLIFIIISASISLKGREVYGKKHSTATVIGFFLVISGALVAFVSGILLTIIFDVTIAIPIVITLPVVLITIGLFLFIKDMGGMLLGSIGAGVVGLFQLLLMVILIVMTNSDSSSTVETMALISIFMVLFTIIGLIILGIGHVVSIRWCNKNDPLIDEQQAEQMKMQQKQFEIQTQQFEMQKEQLKLQQKDVGAIEGRQQPEGQIGSGEEVQGPVPPV